MQSLAITGVALAALISAQPALAAADSTVGASPTAIPTVPKVPATAAQRVLDYNSGYQRPSYGFQLPPQWMAREHIIDYRAYALDRPAAGFGWSRYYDDLVLTDQWGRVYDVANGDDRRNGYRYGQSRRSAGEGIVGGVTGAAVGAIAGNVIAGAGSRLAGSLIGGGVGALAGLAIEAAVSKNSKRRPRYDDGAAKDSLGDRGQYGSYGSHWSGYPQQQAWRSQACNCGTGETVTTTTVTHHGGGGSYMVPRQIVTYQNVYAPVQTKYRARTPAPVAEAKTRTRTRLHTKTY